MRRFVLENENSQTWDDLQPVLSSPVLLCTRVVVIFSTLIRSALFFFVFFLYFRDQTTVVHVKMCARICCCRCSLCRFFFFFLNSNGFLLDNQQKRIQRELVRYLSLSQMTILMRQWNTNFRRLWQQQNDITTVENYNIVTNDFVRWWWRRRWLVYKIEKDDRY